MKLFNLYTANLNGTKLIEASAGTGKTFTLSGLYIRYIVEKNLTPEKILVLTFTKAATAELKTRLREQLIQCKNHLQGIELVDSKQHQLFDLYESYKQQNSALKHVQLALICFDQAAIFTINSFCQKIIEDFNSDCGSPVFQELIVKKDYVKKYVYEFWRKQQAKTPKEILATVPVIDKVINKINGLLNKSHFYQVKPIIEWNNTQDIYNNYIKLAEQWRQQKESLLDYILSGDFHGTTYKIAKRDDYAKDMDEFFRSFNGNVIKFCAGTLESKLGKKNTLKPMPGFFSAFEILYNQVIYTYKANSTGNNFAISYLYECFNYVQQQLITQRTQEGKFDYSDQIRVVHDGINDNSRLVENIAKQWQCIMVDEFQDTDSMQLEIFDKCFNDGKHDLIYVGDPKQAIYDFRGADVFVYNQAKEQTKEQFNLSTNWRSSDRMLESSNAMFGVENAFKFSWLTFSPSSPKPEQELQLNDIYPAVAVIDCDQQSRKLLLAIEIKRFLSEAKVNSELVKSENCAILVNNNRDAIELYEYLLSNNIAVNLLSESGVFTTEVAQQMYYLIRAINYPSQSNMFTVLHGLFFDVGLNQLQQVDGQELLADFVNYRLEMNSTEFLRVIEKIFEDRQVYSRLLQRIDGERHFCDLQHLLELLQEQTEQGNSHNHLEQWLATQIQQAELMENDEQRKRRIESDSKKMSIMTIHKSKGLEFDHVFIPYADKITDKKVNENINLRACLATHDDGKGTLYWRHSKQAQSSVEIEKSAENMRILYVAITRAKHRVYLGLDTTTKNYDSIPIASLIDPIKDQPKLCGTVVSRQLNCDNKYSVDKEIVQLFSPKTFRRNLLKPQSIYSFSALSKKQRIDQEVFEEAAVEIDYNNYFQFPKGAVSGTMQHEILENLDFTDDLSMIKPEVERQLNRYGFDNNWQDCLVKQIHQILNFHLWQNGPKLSEISNSIDEMEFMLPVPSINKQSIGGWLSKHRDRPTSFTQDDLQGYLTGFIDLVFEYKGKYYIIDYKSNYLGFDINDYTQSNLKKAIEHHYYDLQYLLYSVALLKYLRTKKADFSYKEHFGGIAYIFTRGVNGQTGQGVYCHLPDEELLYSMIGAFDVS